MRGRALVLRAPVLPVSRPAPQKPPPGPPRTV